MFLTKYELCLKYNKLPREPQYFYKEFTNIKSEIGLFKRR
jgi:hypothetical protein